MIVPVAGGKANTHTGSRVGQRTHATERQTSLRDPDQTTMGPLRSSLIGRWPRVDHLLEHCRLDHEPRVVDQRFECVLLAQGPVQVAPCRPVEAHPYGAAGDVGFREQAAQLVYAPRVGFTSALKRNRPAAASAATSRP